MGFFDLLLESLPLLMQGLARTNGWVQLMLFFTELHIQFMMKATAEDFCLRNFWKAVKLT